MSDLQIALIAVGCVVVLGILVFNKTQEARLIRADREAAEADRMAAGGVGESAQNEGAVRDHGVEHHLGAPAAGAAVVDTTETGAVVTEAPPVGLDARIDYIARLEFIAAHPGEEVLRRSAEVLRGLRRVAWEGWSDRDERWEALAPSRSYQCVRVGLQLANRQGPATEEELLAFCQDLQSLSTTLVGEIEFPPRAEALRGAIELDRAIADLDIQIGLNVVKRSGPPFAVGVIAQAVAIAGGELAADGRFHVTTSTGAECFSIANLEEVTFAPDELARLSTRGISLAMDVARAPDLPAAFEAFVDFARDVARVVEGELVDDNQRPVSPTALGSIGAEVARVRASLSALGVPAGSTLALRLFS